MTLKTYLLACAGTAIAASAALASGDAPMDTPRSISGPDALFQRTIAREMMRMLPAEQQRAIRDAGAPEAFQAPEVGTGVLVLDERYETLSTYGLTPDAYALVSDGHLNMLTEMAESVEAGRLIPAMCFSPGTPFEVIEVSDLIYKAQQLRYQQTARWTNTATNGGTGGQGDPIILTYSYVPDGTFVPNLGIGLGSGNSALFAWLNGIYGSPAGWQPLFDGVFDRWSELIGTTYVFEPNDDGSNTNTAPGVLGVRGDVRIAAFDFQNDGNGGVLAYNNFPNDGDMVFDAFDTFYNNTGGGSLALRNVIAHEHGHGLGMLHVCPVEETKLMEPFVSFAFDGPQLDDILNGQRHYGDPNEPNNNSGQATPFGIVVPATNTSTFGIVSIDDNSDTDWYSFEILTPTRVTVDAILEGDVYQDGPQTQACNSGPVEDYNAQHDLVITFYDTDGSTVLGVADSTGEGSNETGQIDIAANGTYFFTISGDTTNDIQPYSLDVVGSNPPFIGPSITIPDAPTVLEPGVPTSFTVNIFANNDTLTGTPQLLFDYENDGFQAVDLVFVSGSSWEATLPGALCASTPEFFIEVNGQVQGSVTSPELGASAPLTATVGTELVAFEDNFQTDLGWTVTNGPGLTDGAWERTTPSQGGDARVSDPPSDGDGSGVCFVTDNGADNSDVDGGSTTLTSPSFDVSGQPGATVSYYRWFDNNEGGTAQNAFTETLEVEISNNGGASWVTLESVGPTGGEVSGGWFFVTYTIADFVAPSADVRVRFIADDPSGTIVEAGVDGFSVNSFECEDPQTDPCPCDINGDGSLSPDDINAFVAAFTDGAPGNADIDGDGDEDPDDINAFVTCFTNPPAECQ